MQRIGLSEHGQWRIQHSCYWFASERPRRPLEITPTANTQGMRVDLVDKKPGQPHITAGVTITSIGGVNLLGLLDEDLGSLGAHVLAFGGRVLILHHNCICSHSGPTVMVVCSRVSLCGSQRSWRLEFRLAVKQRCWSIRRSRHQLPQPDVIFELEIATIRSLNSDLPAKVTDYFAGDGDFPHDKNTKSEDEQQIQIASDVDSLAGLPFAVVGGVSKRENAHDDVYEMATSTTEQASEDMQAEDVHRHVTEHARE